MQNKESARSLFRNARREAWIVALVWALAFAWSVVWCYIHGYAHDEASLLVRLGWVEAGPARTPELVLGFPDWVFWGILLPWLACSAFTVWFGIWGMSDDNLGSELTSDPSPPTPLPEGEGSSKGGSAHGH
ncbi:MAG: hypothetical protein L0Y72_12970 [Gemmataceae bacterium]|nr:hypothetical protein [Gemmataceae bacterium]MCI0739950.1 hypothetical protein [Gemmataceae bacterium]